MLWNWLGEINLSRVIKSLLIFWSVCFTLIVWMVKNYNISIPFQFQKYLQHVHLDHLGCHKTYCWGFLPFSVVFHFLGKIALPSVLVHKAPSPPSLEHFLMPCFSLVWDNLQVNENINENYNIFSFSFESLTMPKFVIEAGKLYLILHWWMQIEHKTQTKTNHKTKSNLNCTWTNKEN